MNKLLYSSKLFLNRNSSTILTIVGGVGVVVTSVMAVKATPKALELLKEAEEEKGDELTNLEKVKVAGPVYIPAVVSGVATLSCIFGANVLNKRRQASLMSAYALLDSSYKEYKKKVIDLYGEEAHEHVREEIAVDHFEKEKVETEDDTILFYDEFSERYFNSTMEKVIKAEYELNKKITQWGGASLNEFYANLGIPTVDYGEQLGWSSGLLMESIWSSWLDFDHKKVLIDDDLECYIISMSWEPMCDYEYY